MALSGKSWCYHLLFHFFWVSLGQAPWWKKVNLRGKRMEPFGVIKFKAGYSEESS